MKYRSLKKFNLFHKQKKKIFLKYIMKFLNLIFKIKLIDQTAYFKQTIVFGYCISRTSTNILNNLNKGKERPYLFSF